MSFGNPPRHNDSGVQAANGKKAEAARHREVQTKIEAWHRDQRDIVLAELEEPRRRSKPARSSGRTYP